MGLKEFLSERFLGTDETYFYERIGGKVVEVDKQGKPIMPVCAESGEVKVVSEEEYHKLRNQHRGSINPVIPTRLADGKIRLEPNTSRKNIDSIRRE